MNENKSTTVKNLWDATKASHKREGSVRFSSVAQSCPTLWPHESQHARPPCPSPTPGVHSDSRPSSRWCHPAVSSCRPLLLLPPIPPSIRVFSNESTLHVRWPKYWSFSFSIIPSKEHPGPISFRMDWLDLLAVEGTLKSFLQHHSSKAVEGRKQKVASLVAQTVKLLLAMRETWVWSLGREDPLEKEMATHPSTLA